MKLANLFAAAAVVAGLSLGTTAQAAPLAPITGTAAVVTLNTTIAPLDLIGVGTTFQFGGGQLPAGFSLVSSSGGDLAPVATPGSTLTTNSITATVGSPVGFTASWGAFGGNVVQASLNPGATELNRTVSVIALGTFTPAGTLAASFGPGPMSLTFSATQTNTLSADDEVVLGQVSASYTIASPPAVQVPEPASLALLGIALGSAGFFRRRR